MNFAIKLAFKIFLTGVAMLVIAMLFVLQTSYQNMFNTELEHAQLVIDEISVSIDLNIQEKVKNTKTLAMSPIMHKALDESNTHFSSLSEQTRQDEIQSLNEQWKASNNENDPFIQNYTDNQVSRFLKDLQNNLKGEYGEIFLTNKYGALVASTAKLTTLAHAHKYWWKGAYNDGEGAIFLMIEDLMRV